MGPQQVNLVKGWSVRMHISCPEECFDHKNFLSLFGDNCGYVGTIRVYGMKGMKIMSIRGCPLEDSLLVQNMKTYR